MFRDHSHNPDQPPRKKLTMSQSLEVLHSISMLDTSTIQSPRDFLNVFDRSAEAFMVTLGNILARTGTWQNAHNITHERRNNEGLLDRITFQFDILSHEEPVLTNMSITSGQRGVMQDLPSFVLEYAGFSSLPQTETGFTNLVMLNNGVLTVFNQESQVQQQNELTLINSFSSGIQRATRIILEAYNVPGSTLGKTQDFPQPLRRR